MLLSAITPTSLSTFNAHNCHVHTTLTLCKATTNTPTHKPYPSLTLLTSANANSSSLRHVSSTCDDDGGEGDDVVSSCCPSASALAEAIRNASSSAVEFVERVDKDGKNNKGLVLPSPDFHRLCVEQLDLFRRIVHPHALLSVYVRPAGSYVMDRLELRQVTSYPGVDTTDIVILISNFSIPTGLRAAEANLLNQQAEFIPGCRAVVFPMVKHPFVVGFLVAELPRMEMEREGHDVKQCPFPNALPPCTNSKLSEFQTFKESPLEMYNFTIEQRLNAINISRSLAMAYVMDQRAMLLQQSSWQNNIRMSDLVEQIRGPLSSIRTLSKMLSVHMKKSEISYDIVEAISLQGDLMRDTLQQLQDAVYLTKANIIQYNEETLKKMHHSNYANGKSVRSQLSNYFSGDISLIQESDEPPFFTPSKDIEMPMPPLALAPIRQQGIRPCNVRDVLADLVGAAKPLAHKQQRVVELFELSPSLEVAVEEPPLRQALSNLIEGALLRTHVRGKVAVVSTRAPAGGALVTIDDDGPDMHYMTQMHSLTPFGADLLSKDKVEDNMTWNFVAGLTVAREILESYGCVVRVISPRTTDNAHGARGTRIELWLPSFSSSHELDGPAQEV